MAEDRALRVGGRARRVNHGRVVVPVDLLHRVLPGDAVGGIEIGAGHDVIEGQRPGRQLAARLDADDVLEGRAFGPDRLDLVSLLGVLDEDHLRTDVVDDECRLARLRLRVDRAGHRAERERGKVGDRPLGPGPGDDRDAVAVSDAEISQPERDGGDPVPQLPVRPARPRRRVVALGAIGLSQLPAHRLASGVALDGPMDEVDDVPRLLLGPDRQRLDLGRLHQPAAGAGRHRSLLRPSWRTLSSSPCATMSRWIWFVPS